MASIIDFYFILNELFEIGNQSIDACEIARCVGALTEDLRLHA